MPKETGASARPAVKATSRKLQNAKFKQPLVMPPADDSTPREDIPDVDLAVFLHLAAKFKGLSLSGVPPADASPGNM